MSKKLKNETTNKLEEVGIRLIRLTSGEEILCKLFTLNEITYLVKKPAILIPTDKQGHIAIAPWCPYADTTNGVEINKNNIMFVLRADKQMENEYNSAFGSGIITAPAGTDKIMGAPALKLTD